VLFSNFMLARPLDGKDLAKRLTTPFPYGNLWPPPAIPARHRVAGLSPPSGPDSTSVKRCDRPMKRSEASDQAFRIRQWMEMAGPSPLPGLLLRPALGLSGMMQIFAGGAQVSGPTSSGPGGARISGQGTAGVHIGEEVITYSTLDPKLYTPTQLKPWRGIWVGDYSGHGCEFLLINQPDDPDVTDEELGLIPGFDESEESWQDRRHKARMYRGRLEAIKLTGDLNVPRGEYTFVADDLGERGFVGVAQEPPFQGIRVVSSKGHVAGTGFHNGEFSCLQSLEVGVVLMQ
jgi:Cyclin D1 binding domain